MKKLNKNGFTLIELLAVIVIMGILMMVAIPAMSRYIENSRRDTFLSTSKEYVNAVRNMWASDSLYCTVGGEQVVSSAVDDGNYYIEIDSKNPKVNLLDSGGKSSWGNRDVKGYVRVNIDTPTETDEAGVTTTGTRVTKYYIALSDNTHGIKEEGMGETPDKTKWVEADSLVRGNVDTSGVKYTDAEVPADGVKCIEG